MKKLIFVLLLTFAMVGFVSAFDDTAHPPGGITLEAETACIGASYCDHVYQVSAPVQIQDAVQCVLSAGIITLTVATIKKPNGFMGTGRRVNVY